MTGWRWPCRTTSRNASSRIARSTPWSRNRPWLRQKSANSSSRAGSKALSPAATATPAPPSTAPASEAPAASESAEGYEVELADSDKYGGGLLTRGYQSIVIEPQLSTHTDGDKPYVELVPASGHASSTNLSRIRIYTDDAAGFVLPSRKAA